MGRDGISQDNSSPYLSVEEAAEYVRCRSVKAFDWWVRSRSVPSLRRGRIRLFRREVLDRVLRNDALKLDRSA
jgi:excisionase family DNA binding protein